MNSLYLISIALVLVSAFQSCSQKETDIQEDTYELVEIFADSTEIGNTGLHKVELAKYINTEKDSSFITMKLFMKKNNNWLLVQNDTIPSNSLTKLNPEIKDYNSDGLQDLIFCSDIAANLANAEYTILLFMKNSNRLEPIGKGWNMTYSETLKMFREKYISSTTYSRFFKIQGDSLTKVFEIDLAPTHEYITEFGDDGKVIKADSTFLKSADETLPAVKHWIREWAIKDTLY